MFNYNILPNTDEAVFEEVCNLIEKAMPKYKREKLLIDVDSSFIQVFANKKSKITVINDEDVGALYIISDERLTVFE